MRILYLIGNGFDLAQGLKTRYSDFYDARILNKSLPSGILTKLQSSIGNDTASWADMEKKLGEFSSEMEGIEDVDKVYDFLKTELKEYLKEEQDRIAPSTTEEVSVMRELILTPEKYLLPESSDSIRSLIDSSSSGVSIDAISFNYTNVFEKSLAYKGRPIDLKKDGRTAKFNSFFKVHGDLDREMVMGVADADQIANKSLALDIDALEVFVKPRTTALRRDYVCSNCSNLIARADIIVFYGLSIGETDRNWWKLVTDRLYSNANVRLIIYSHLEDAVSQYDYTRISRKERSVYKKLYSCNGQTQINYTRLNNQIIISFDDRLFEGICSKVMDL